jgi:hypothetical protein
MSRDEVFEINGIFGAGTGIPKGQMISDTERIMLEIQLTGLIPEMINDFDLITHLLAFHSVELQNVNTAKAIVNIARLRRCLNAFYTLNKLGFYPFKKRKLSSFNTIDPRH